MDYAYFSAQPQSYQFTAFPPTPAHSYEPHDDQSGDPTVSDLISPTTDVCMLADRILLTDFVMLYRGNIKTSTRLQMASKTSTPASSSPLQMLSYPQASIHNPSRHHRNRPMHNRHCWTP